MNASISEGDLHACANGRLDPARLMQVATRLAAHPERRTQIERWRARSAQTHRAYDHLLDQPIPAANSGHWCNARELAPVAWLTLDDVGDPAALEPLSTTNC